MNNNFKELLERFKFISRKHWIKGVSQNTNSIGLTFEKELNKLPDSMFFPDYNGIEIKCTQRYSRYPISLFSIALEGPKLYETNRILQKYGKQDHVYRDKKILMTQLYIDKPTIVNNKWYFDLEMDKENSKIFLVIYDINFNLIEKEAYIDLNELKKKVEVKLKELAIVEASKKEINKEKHFRYYQIIFYQLKSVEKFIDMLENNQITIKIVCRVSRSGKEEGRQRNKSITMSLDKKNIEQLFNKIYKYNKDIEKDCFTIMP